MNMVVHDLRNPTNQIDFAIDQVISNSQKTFGEYNDFYKQNKKNLANLKKLVRQRIQELYSKADSF